MSFTSCVANNEYLHTTSLTLSLGFIWTIRRIECAKSYDRWSFSHCDKDLNDLLLISSIMFSFMSNDSIKAFHLIDEEGLEIFKCQVFPDHCHSLQSSETTGSLFCASIFQEPEVAKAQTWRIR
jgi:hypothetical protein